MSRVKTGVVRHRRHKKVLDANKGFRGANRRLYKRANEAFLHSGAYAYVGRKDRKRDFRRLWIVRISAGLEKMGAELNYSRLIAGLKKAQIALDRKILAELAVNDFNTFKKVVSATGLTK